MCLRKIGRDFFPIEVRDVYNIHHILRQALSHMLMSLSYEHGLFIQSKPFRWIRTSISSNSNCELSELKIKLSKPASIDFSNWSNCRIANPGSNRSNCESSNYSLNYVIEPCPYHRWSKCNFIFLFFNNGQISFLKWC